MPAGWCPGPERDGRTAGAAVTRRPLPTRRVVSGHGPVVVLVDAVHGVRARPARTGERLAARLFPHRLDRALAAGACPDGDPGLSLRAARLAAPPTRQALAGAVCRILRAADEGPRPHPRAHPPMVRLERVAAAHRELETLVDRLLAPAPVPARGVALVMVLLADGAGPLYRPGSPVDLGSAVMEAVRELDPVPG